MRSFIIYLVFTLLVSCTSTPSKPKTKGENSKKSTPTSKKFKLPSAQEEVINQARTALELLAKKSPTANEALELFTAQAIKAIFIKDGDILIIEAPDNDNFFFIVADGNKKETEKKFVFAEFICESRIMKLNNYGEKIDFYALGSTLVHELEHARACISGEETTTQGGITNEWLLFEFKAYTKARQSLNEATNGQWQNALNEAQKNRRAEATRLGYDTSTFSFGISKNDKEEIKKIFGELNALSFSIIATQYNIDVNTTNIEKVAEEKNLNETIKTRGYLALMDAHFRQDPTGTGISVEKLLKR